MFRLVQTLTGLPILSWGIPGDLGVMPMKGKVWGGSLAIFSSSEVWRLDIILGEFQPLSGSCRP